MANAGINAEITKLDPSSILVFFVLDASSIGGGFFRFYSGTATMNQVIVWQGNEYTPLPMEARGFEYKGTGSPPRPSIVLGNIGGAISSLCLNYDDLIGARLIRKRTYARFLDGMATADPTQQFPDDIFSVERKAQETKLTVELELATALDVDDVSIPRRQYLANLCPWRYRGDGCFFAGDTVIADSTDTVPGISLTDRGEWNAGTTYHEGDFVYIQTASGPAYYWVYEDGGTGISGTAAAPSNGNFWKADQCSKRIRGCGLRFGSDPKGLPFGGYPFADRQN